MKAVVLEGKDVRVKDIAKPKPAADEALIKVQKAGICNTDLELAKGYMDFQGILGHEFVGTIEYALDPSWVGKRVVGEINISCGQCALCRAGLTKHCAHRDVLGIVNKNGAFAEYLTIPLKNCHAIPDVLSDRMAVFTEPLAAALEILESVKIDPEEKVLILGDGKLGLLTAQVMRQHAENVTCVGKHPHHLDMLEQSGIVTHESGTELERQFSVVVEATGNENGFLEALRLVLPQGVIVLKSTFHGESRIDVSKIVVDEIHLIGSRCGPFAKAIRQLERNRINVEELIDGDFPLEQWGEAFALAQKPGTLKVLLSL